jgi:hypothetical protein
VAGENSQAAALAGNLKFIRVQESTGRRFALESKSHGACAPVAVIQEVEIYPSDSRRAHATWIWTSTDAELLNMNTPPFSGFDLTSPSVPARGGTVKIVQANRT